MGKRTKRLIVTATAGLLVMSLGSAHADVSVSIDNEDGSVVWSLPGLPGPVEPIEVGPVHVDEFEVGPVHAGPADVPVTATVGPVDQPSYPDAITTAITGTAHFDTAEGSAVLYEFVSEGADGSDIVVYSNEAATSCGEPDESGAFDCTWSFGAPFVMGAGNYTVNVTAVQPDGADEDTEPDSQTASIDILVI